MVGVVVAFPGWRFFQFFFGFLLLQILLRVSHY
jgi:hypothetical protein